MKLKDDIDGDRRKMLTIVGVGRSRPFFWRGRWTAADSVRKGRWRSGASQATGGGGGHPAWPREAAGGDGFPPAGLPASEPASKPAASSGWPAERALRKRCRAAAGLAKPGVRSLKGLADAWPWRARQGKAWQRRRRVRHGHPGRGGHGQERRAQMGLTRA
jgi:hypothetical protein